MREIIFRGKPKNKSDYILLSETFKKNCKDGFVYGSLVISKGKYFICVGAMCNVNMIVNNGITTLIEVIPETIGQYTGLTDKKGTKIFEGNIVTYNTYDDFNCRSVVKIGTYKQDGSGGEYDGTLCFGVFVEVDNFTSPDWVEEDDLFTFNDYMKQQNLLEVNEQCEVIGNIYDNPELLEE